jgi:hypothetical protein
MIYTLAAGLASIISFGALIAAVAWYAAPWLNARPRADALIALLWIHAFRYVALQVFSAQRVGLAVTDGMRDQIAAGDVIGALLAFASIVALRARSRFAVPLVWLFVAETLYDLAASTVEGVREHLFETANGVTWLILTFYVPALWISLGLVAWQLFARRFEPLSAGAKAGLRVTA